MTKSLRIQDKEREVNGIIAEIRAIEGCELFWQVRFVGGTVQLRPSVSVFAAGGYYERDGAWCGSASYSPHQLLDQLTFWLGELQAWAKLKRMFPTEDDESVAQYLDFSQTLANPPR